VSTTIERLTTALADRYRVEQELGAGGMATVYLAHDLRHERDVAIKVLHPDLGAALGAERFLAEIKTTAKLQHPHILPLLDSGAADTLLYYVMPYVRGETLRARLDREKQLPIADAVRIAREVAGALDHAHKQGIIHRDIKPENILLQDGSALVADFGIALAVQQAGTQRLTQTGLSLGTPQYMSPEQAMGEKTIDARSDIYALGAVTYEMLTGDPPFTGSTVQAVVAKVISADPERPSLARKTIPHGVEQAVLTAIAKLPADRFASAASLAEAMAAGMAIAERPTAAPAPMASATRSRVLPTIAGALAVGVVLGAALWRQFASGATTANSTVVNDRTQVTYDGRSGWPAITDDGAGLAYVRVACEKRDHYPLRLLGIDGEDPVRCPASLFVRDSGASRAVEIISGATVIRQVRWLASGTAVALDAVLDSARAGLFVVPRLGGAPRRVAASGIFDTHPSGDTLFLAQSRPGDRTTLLVIVASSGAVVDSLPLGAGSLAFMAISPDGQRILTGADAGRNMRIWRRDGRVLDSLQRVSVRNLAHWTPDGRGLLMFEAGVGREDRFVRVGVTADGHFDHTVTSVMPRVQTLYAGQFDVARRTGHLAFALGDWRHELVTFPFTSAGPGPATTASSGSGYISSPGISADGRSLAFLRNDGTGDNLYDRRTDQPSAEDRPASATRGTGVNYVTFADGGRSALFIKSDRDSLWVTWFNLTNREFRTRPLDSRWGLRLRLAVASDARLIDRTTDGRVIVRIDTTLTRLDTIARIPDSLRIVEHEVSPDGQSVAVLAAAPRSTLLFVSPLAPWNPRLVGSWPAPAPSTNMSWRADGGIYFASWDAGGTAPVLWRASANGSTPPRRVGQVPSHCSTVQTVLARMAPIGACTMDNVVYDVFVASLPGITR
jgi:WD40 repeat protein